MSKTQETAAQRLEAARARLPEFEGRIASARATLEAHQQAVAKHISENVSGVAAYAEDRRAEDRRLNAELGIAASDAEAEAVAFREHLAALETAAAEEAVLSLEAEVETRKATVDNAVGVIIAGWPAIVAALAEIEASMLEIAQLARQREKLIALNKLNPPQWGTGHARSGEQWSFDIERFTGCLCAQFQRDGYGKLALSPSALEQHAPVRRPSPGK